MKSLLKLKINFIPVIELLFTVQLPAKGQYALRTAADAEYNLFNYNKAIDLYEKAFKKKASLSVVERLADCNARVHNYKQTESWYAIAVNMPGSSVENHLNYARALQNNFKYNEAEAEYRKYTAQDKKVTPEENALWILSCEAALKWMQRPVNVVITNQRKLNSIQSDWGAVPYRDGVVFVSDRVNKSFQLTGERKPFFKFGGQQVPNKRKYGWTGNAYQRLYMQTDTGSVQLFSFSPGTDYHVGPASFTADGNEMYFALTKVLSKQAYIRGVATINIEIYDCKRGALGKWETPAPFKYNNAGAYSVGDASISKDGTSLYFVSNMPGGVGGTDIYKCLRSKGGDWGTPVNLKEINTTGNERSPYAYADSLFYFSSDGLIGMGGLDMYHVKVTGGHAGKPVNLGYPFNSPQDDFAYCSTTDSTGYFSSNRMDGHGADDIYHFTTKSVASGVKSFIFSAKVCDKKTKQPLSTAIVSLYKRGGDSLKVQTDREGNFIFIPEVAADYTLCIRKTGYRADVIPVTTYLANRSHEQKKILYLEPIDRTIRLDNIYYDFNTWNIRGDAILKLDKLAEMMRDDPVLRVELSSHTDSGGRASYNRILS